MKCVTAMSLDVAWMLRKKKEKKKEKGAYVSFSCKSSPILRLVILSFFLLPFFFFFFCSIDLRKNGAVYDKETISFNERLGKRRKKRGEGEERTANTKLTAELKE